MKITRHLEDPGYDSEVLCAVRYGELILPSKAEEDAAVFENARKRARTIRVPRSTFDKDQAAFAELLPQLQDIVASGFSPLKSSSSDVSLRCGDATFHVHRSVLGARCDHFAALFHSGMRDAQDRVIEVIPQCEPQNLRDFLGYLYTDQVTLTPDNEQELLELASFYQVKRLVAQCEVALREGVDLENACQLLEVADRSGALQLKRFCESYIIDHFAKVKATESFRQMPHELLLDITTTACHHLSLATTTHHKLAE